MTHSERVAEYLKQCGTFYLATVDGVRPCIRPAHDVCVCGDVIHFLFLKEDEIYGQLLNNDSAEICATHPDKSFIRFACHLREDKGEEPRKAMIKSCEESLDYVRNEGKQTIFRVDFGKVIITDFTGKTEEFSL